MVMSLRKIPTCVMAASGSIFGFKVQAGDEKPSKKIKISELPVYESPESKVEFTKEEPCWLQNEVSKVRKVVWKSMESVQDTTDKIKDKYEIGKSHFQSTVDAMKEHDLIFRVGVISLTGLTVYALSRGRTIKRLFYGGVGAGIPALFYYYDEAKEGFVKLSDIAKEQWDKRK